MLDKLSEFVRELAICKVTGDVFNHYSLDIQSNSIRRENLFIYLKYMQEIKPNVLMVGEAPGFHGCRLTGVPFTSEFILLDDNGIFGKTKGYRKTKEVPRKKKKQSATIVL
ncbi:hypothetical protein [Desulfosporosinus sp. SB140]|uniref:hypothetical protein n=1 Tax=Desulfosporosinus paludis TaxID=3115649 RepID=UPI00388F27F5